MAEQQLRVRLLALTQGFNQNMSAAQSKLTAFGTKAKQVGASLRSIQLPLALAGGAAVKMAVDFDKSMTQIKSLVGVAGDEVDAMGVTAKKMAADTGQSASAAAEALFFITSAGLRGSEAMEVLEASLKAAAVGLGETKTVADLATSAMNAYGSDVLSASNATDVLVSAVREGKLEADELAQSMGRVLPVASAMGVRFDEVGAAFAALSRTGTNAAEASTQVRGILTSLLKPTTDAQKALAEMGLSTQGLRQEIREKGLLSALETLKTNFDGNDEAAQRVFGNVRALSGIMDLLGANVQTTRDIFDSMTRSAGATDKAFKATTEVLSFQFKKAINEVSVELTEMGAIILKEIVPLIKDLSKFIVDLFKDFSELDESTKKFRLGLAAIVLVAPTVISAIGGITTAVSALSAALMGISIAKISALAGVLAFLSLKGDEGDNDFLTQLEIDINKFESEELVRKSEETAAAIDLIQQSLSKPISGLNQDDGGASADSSVKELITDLDDLEHAIYKADQTAKGIDLDTRFDLAAGSASVEYFGNVVANTANTIVEPINKIAEAVKKSTQQVSNLTLMIGRDLARSFGAFLDGENFMKSMINTLKDLAKQLIATAAAAAILAVLTGGNFGAIFQGLSGINLVGGAGTGGGAAPGANSFFPDPAGRGSNINLTGQFRIDGQDLVVAVERANKQRVNFI